jgi:hypothetical protein
MWLAISTAVLCTAVFSYSSASGSLATTCCAWANGTMRSRSPCHHRTGTFTSSRRKAPIADPGSVDADQSDVLSLCVNTGFGGNLPAGTGSSMQPEDGTSLRVAELGESELTIVADGDIAFQFGARDGDNHLQSVALGANSSPEATNSACPIGRPLGRRGYRGAMRAIAPVLLACILLAGCGTPAAAGPRPTETAPTTVAPPERPPGNPGVVFTDNPSIVNSYPLPFDAWSRLGTDDAVAVHFTLGSPDCYGVHTTVHETTEAVTVELRGGSLPEAVGRVCTMIAVFGTLHVPLQNPLGDRTVLSVY